MTPRQWLADYLLLTSFAWFLYLIWLIPFQLFWVGMDMDQFIVWLSWGTVLEFIFAYPISKVIIRVGPKIESWTKTHI